MQISSSTTTKELHSLLGVIQKLQGQRKIYFLVLQDSLGKEFEKWK